MREALEMAVEYIEALLGSDADDSATYLYLKDFLEKNQ